MIDFYLPKRERDVKRPYKLTRSEVDILQRLADGTRFKEMTTPRRDSSYLGNVAWEIRTKMGAATTVEAVAIALRTGIIK
jgi:DNA-binding CsgD family transcriptional regulator